jgi:nitric oxide reductase large subunit
MAIMIPLFWLLMLFYGLSLLRASKKRNTGITLIILFFLPIAVFLVLSIVYGLFFNLSLTDLYRIGCGMNAAHYTECYPEGYFPK